MKVTTKVYHDEKLGTEADISDITNWIEDEKDLYEIINDLFERFNGGWSDFKVQKVDQIEGLKFQSYVVVEFRKLKEWKYIKMAFLK